MSALRKELRTLLQEEHDLSPRDVTFLLERHAVKSQFVLLVLLAHHSTLGRGLDGRESHLEITKFVHCVLEYGLQRGWLRLRGGSSCLLRLNRGLRERPHHRVELTMRGWRSSGYKIWMRIGDVNELQLRVLRMST
jgi:hypothetical protein